MSAAHFLWDEERRCWRAYVPGELILARWLDEPGWLIDGFSVGNEEFDVEGSATHGTTLTGLEGSALEEWLVGRFDEQQQAGEASVRLGALMELDSLGAITWPG